LNELDIEFYALSSGLMRLENFTFIKHSPVSRYIMSCTLLGGVCEVYMFSGAEKSLLFVLFLFISLLNIINIKRMNVEEGQAKANNPTMRLGSTFSHQKIFLCSQKSHIEYQFGKN
jgi:hypothetical protein